MNPNLPIRTAAAAALALTLTAGFSGCDRPPPAAPPSVASQPASASPTLEQRVKQIVAKQLKLKAENLKLTDRFIKDLKADSLDAVELIISIEDEFKLEIADADAEKIGTIGDFVTYLKAKGK